MKVLTAEFENAQGSLVLVCFGYFLHFIYSSAFCVGIIHPLILLLFLMNPIHVPSPNQILIRRNHTMQSKCSQSTYGRRRQRMYARKREPRVHRLSIQPSIVRECVCEREVLEETRHKKMVCMYAMPEPSPVRQRSMPQNKEGKRYYTRDEKITAP